MLLFLSPIAKTSKRLWGSKFLPHQKQNITIYCYFHFISRYFYVITTNVSHFNKKPFCSDGGAKFSHILVKFWKILVIPVDSGGVNRACFDFAVETTSNSKRDRDLCPFIFTKLVDLLRTV